MLLTDESPSQLLEVPFNSIPLPMDFAASKVTGKLRSGMKERTVVEHTPQRTSRSKEECVHTFITEHPMCILRAPDGRLCWSIHGSLGSLLTDWITQAACHFSMQIKNFCHVTHPWSLL